MIDTGRVAFAVLVLAFLLFFALALCGCAGPAASRYERPCAYPVWVVVQDGQPDWLREHTADAVLYLNHVAGARLLRYRGVRHIGTSGQPYGLALVRIGEPDHFDVSATTHTGGLHYGSGVGCLDGSLIEIRETLRPEHRQCVVRHELCHALGCPHTMHGLMAEVAGDPRAGPDTVRFLRIRAGELDSALP